MSDILSGPLQFEPHGGFGSKDADGDRYPFGYISTAPTPRPIFELGVILGFAPDELVVLAKRMAAANVLVDALVNLLDRVERNGGLGAYDGGPAFVVRAAREALELAGVK
jgi:hypothetical protein